MSDLNVQMCPETGICSIIKKDGQKIDLISTEVSQVRDASGNPDAMRQILAQIDPGFAEGLNPEELDQVSKDLTT
jgi:hypothetical protein